MSEKVYKAITDRILASLEQGTVPWHRPWKSGLPVNLATKKPYRGFNILTLSFAGFASPYWVTLRQANKLGGKVKQGEKGFPVVFWKWLDIIDKQSGEPKRIPFARYTTAFNVEQTEGLEKRIPQGEKLDFSPIEACEKLVNGFKASPTLIHGGARACYNPKLDAVHMPPRESFENEAAYYSTLFHELTHSTGHEKRLNRPSLTDACPFGSTNYSKEELIAELGAAMLCGIAGIENATVDNSAAYVSNWLARLGSDRKLLVQAAQAAQKACDYIQGKKWNNE